MEIIRVMTVKIVERMRDDIEEFKVLFKFLRRISLWSIASHVKITELEEQLPPPPVLFNLPENQ